MRYKIVVALLLLSRAGGPAYADTFRPSMAQNPDYRFRSTSVVSSEEDEWQRSMDDMPEYQFRSIAPMSQNGVVRVDYSEDGIPIFKFQTSTDIADENHWSIGQFITAALGLDGGTSEAGEGNEKAMSSIRRMPPPTQAPLGDGWDVFVLLAILSFGYYTWRRKREEKADCEK